MVVGLMTQKISSFFLVLLLSLLVATSALASDGINQNPVYKGPIYLIDEPIDVRFTPFSKSTTSDVSTVLVKVAGQNIEEKSIKRGSTETIKVENNLNILIAVDTIETIKQGSSQYNSTDLLMSLKVTPLGKILKFDLTSSDMSAQGVQQTKEIIKQALTKFPKEGVNKGYKFENQLNIGVGVVTAVGTVLGKTIYNDRQTLVVDFGESLLDFSIDGDLSPENSSILM